MSVEKKLNEWMYDRLRNFGRVSVRLESKEFYPNQLARCMLVSDVKFSGRQIRLIPNFGYFSNHMPLMNKGTGIWSYPNPSFLRRTYCLISGGHAWRKFLWSGMSAAFDCDCCSKCFKFRGPLDPFRKTKKFPYHIIWE